MKHLSATALSISLAATGAAQAQGDGALEAVSPALAAHSAQTLDGDVWRRPGLGARDRSIVTVAALIARNQATDMPGEFARALDNGVKPGELSEIITHLAFYAGWPTAVNAGRVALEVFDKD